MSSSIILSNYLEPVAKEAEAPERSIIYSWNDATERQFSEDVIVVDTKFHDGPSYDRETPVAGEGTYRTMSFLENSLDNLLESGRVLIALLDRPTELYATDSRTVGFDNYYWLPREIGQIQTFPIHEEDDLNPFIRPSPDHLESLPVETVERESIFNTYFTNVEGSWHELLVENSSITDYERISTISNAGVDALSGIVINGWEKEECEFNPDGSLVLVPRPDEFWFDVDDWFRSLLQIGYKYASESESIDQFNRLLGRTTYDPLKDVYEICHRFPNSASVLNDRRGDREPIEINDEYDVQYILDALLRTRFDDVRPEEYGPSHGGPAPRIDFLIKNETIAIEAKITRSSRGNDEIRTELAEDKEQYRSHPDCEYLICYIYDPIHEMENPAGFESDLSEETDNLTTEVIISSTPRFTSP